MSNQAVRRLVSSSPESIKSIINSHFPKSILHFFIPRIFFNFHSILMKNYFLFIYKEKNWKNLEIPKILGKYIMVKLGNTKKY